MPHLCFAIVSGKYQNIVVTHFTNEACVLCIRFCDHNQSGLHFQVWNEANHQTSIKPGPDSFPYAGDTFYVIEDGTFLIYNDAGQELARVSKGSCFGELALLNQVKTSSSGLSYMSLPGRLPQSRVYACCVMEAMLRFSQGFTTVSVVKQKHDKEDISYWQSVKEKFSGTQKIFVQAPRAASVRALTSGHLLTLTRKNFNELLGSLADIRQMWRFEALGMVSLPRMNPPKLSNA